MEENLAKATAASTEVDFHGERVKLYPLGFTDWGQMEQWMRSQIINATKEAIKNDLDLYQTDRRDILHSAMREAQRITISSCLSGGLGLKKQEGETNLEFGMRIKAAIAENPDQQPAAFLDTSEGMLRVVHLSMKHSDPKLRLSQLDDKFRQDYSLLVELYAQVLDLSFPETDEDGAETEKNSIAGTPSK